MKKVLLAHTHSGAPGGAPCALSEASRCAVALLVRQRLDPAGWGAAALPGGAWQARLWAAGGLTPKLLGRRRESVLGPFAKTATRKVRGNKEARGKQWAKSTHAYKGAPTPATRQQQRPAPGGVVIGTVHPLAAPLCASGPPGAAAARARWRRGFAREPAASAHPKTPSEARPPPLRRQLGQSRKARPACRHHLGVGSFWVACGGRSARRRARGPTSTFCGGQGVCWR